MTEIVKIFILALVAATACGIAGGLLLQRFNRVNTGFLLGPIGIVVAGIMRLNLQKDEELSAKAVRKEKKCPFCAELVLVDAKLCKHCNRLLEVTDPESDD